MAEAIAWPLGKLRPIAGRSTAIGPSSGRGRSRREGRSNCHSHLDDLDFGLEGAGRLDCLEDRDEVARASGLNCDLFGGIIVDDTLTTSDPAVFAIGECARHRGQTYGVVAPGYAMADTLAAQLSHKQQAFQGASITTRLKVPNVDLTCVGESNVRDLATRCVSHASEDALRQLVVRKGRIVGATVA